VRLRARSVPPRSKEEAKKKKGSNGPGSTSSGEEIACIKGKSKNLVFILSEFVIGLVLGKMLM
jgi:hypothetical protein